MHTLTGRNINTIWPMALTLLRSGGVKLAPSRNGGVVKMNVPVTTCYLNPMERVLFDPIRDANPFFHLAEALWMIGGRRDVAFVEQFAKRMRDFSDDGVNFHGAYGFRWRRSFLFDQLNALVSLLAADPGSRRAMLSIWDPAKDLGTTSVDLPCNVMVKFSIEDDGLRALVFNRSNDVIWGAYGANVVQFSMLQEYLAMRLGVGVGPLWQVSSDWHAYRAVLEARPYLTQTATHDTEELYERGEVVPFPMADSYRTGGAFEWEQDLQTFLHNPVAVPSQYLTPYFRLMVAPMFGAWATRNPGGLTPTIDWHLAASRWLARRAAT